jgi:hypothetical protein
LGRPGWYNRLPARRSLGIDARRDPISEILAARAQLGQAFARQVAHPGLQLLHAGADLIIALRFALAGLGRGGSGCFRIQCGGNLRLGQVHLRPGHSGRPGFYRVSCRCPGIRRTGQRRFCPDSITDALPRAGWRPWPKPGRAREPGPGWRRGSAMPLARMMNGLAQR